MRKIFALLLAATVAGCATTSEMPLAQNMVRIDTQASGALFVGSAGSMTMKKAAEATLSRGYSHFRLEQAQTSSGRRMVGMTTNTFGNAQASIYGNQAYGTYTGTSYSSANFAPTRNVGVTVVMFHANEAGAKGAFDAAAVLKKGGNY